MRNSLENARNFWANWFKGSKGGKNTINHRLNRENNLDQNIPGPAPPSQPPATGGGQESPSPAGLGVQHGKQRHDLTVSQGESQIVQLGMQRIDLTVSQGESQIVEFGQIERYGKQRVDLNFPQIEYKGSEISLEDNFQDNVENPGVGGGNVTNQIFTPENPQFFAHDSGVQGTQNFPNLRNQFFPETVESRDGSENGQNPPLEITYEETSEVDPETGEPRRIPFFYFEDEPPAVNLENPWRGRSAGEMEIMKRGIKKISIPHKKLGLTQEILSRSKIPIWNNLA